MLTKKEKCILRRKGQCVHRRPDYHEAGCGHYRTCCRKYGPMPVDLQTRLLHQRWFTRGLLVLVSIFLPLCGLRKSIRDTSVTLTSHLSKMMDSEKVMSLAFSVRVFLGPGGETEAAEHRYFKDLKEGRLARSSRSARLLGFRNFCAAQKKYAFEQ